MSEPSGSGKRGAGDCHIPGLADPSSGRETGPQEQLTETPKCEVECKQFIFKDWITRKLEGTTIAEWAMLIVTLTYVIFAGAQWKVMNGQLKVMKGSLEQAKTAQTDSYVAEIQQRERYELDERAWVGIKSVDFDQMEPGKPLRTIVTIANSGKTVALRLHCPGLLETSLSPVEDINAAETSVPHYQDNPTAVGGSLFPNAEVGLWSETPWIATQDQIADIKSGKLLVYVAGEINYFDFSGHKHVTTYFERYTPNTKRFQVAGPHNDAN